MKLATNYLLIAIIVELFFAFGTLLILSDFQSIFQVISRKADILGGGLICIIFVALLLGQKINYSKIPISLRKFLGIFYMFLFLYLYLGMVVFIANPSEISYHLEFILLYTTIFGGLQTLCVGMWLGYKLSGLKS